MTLAKLFKDIANVIRIKLNTAEPVTASDFPEKIREIGEGIPVAGIRADDIVKDDNGYLRKTNDSETIKDVTIAATSLGPSVLKYFYAGSHIGRVNFKYLREIKEPYALEHAFANSYVREAHFPQLSVIDWNIYGTGGQIHTCFADCTNLSSVTFDSLVSIRGVQPTPFTGCTNLSTIEFPRLSSLKQVGTLFGGSHLSSIVFNKEYQTQIENSDGFADIWGRGAGKAEVIFKDFSE